MQVVYHHTVTSLFACLIVLLVLTITGIILDMSESHCCQNVFVTHQKWFYCLL